MESSVSGTRVRVRFAPSPTGPLHVGGVRTALFNYLFARRHGGDFLLRIEDTDQTRFVPGAEAYIFESLKWLGIEPDYSPVHGGPDAPYRQSERKPMYRTYAEQLLAAGHAYYAFDTPEEIEAMKARMEAAGMKAPQYNAVTREYMKNSLTLPADDVQARLDRGEAYVIRIKLPRKEDIRFHDLIRGYVTVNTSQMDDKVLLKSDGMPTYHLANIVDDHLMAISHVIRGEEWLPSAPLHVFMYRAFGWEAPQFAHLPLLLSPDGNGKLSKRDGDKYGFPVFPLDWVDPATGARFSGYREAGYLPEAFLNFLALLGWSPGNDREIFTREELAEVFSLERVGKSGVKFDKQKSVWFNSHYLHHTPADRLWPHLKAQLEQEGIALPSETYAYRVLDLVKEKLQSLNDLLHESRFFFVRPATYDRSVVEKNWNPTVDTFFADLESWLAGTSDYTAPAIEERFKTLAADHGLKPTVPMPVFRHALTAVKYGPTVFQIAETLGQTETTARLRNFLTFMHSAT